MRTEITSHPQSLRIFFSTEMWERYGFYVIQSLLALYLAAQFHWPDGKIHDLVGTFTALTYLSPLIGGWIADHLLGQKRAIITGAFFLFCSYLALFIIGSAQSLILTLAGIAVGTGLLKPNISSLLGNEYPVESPLRERGFTIFYMGITTGIILGTTLPSLINQYWGWPASFASAALGIVIALGTFVYGMYRYQLVDYNPVKLRLINILKALCILVIMGYFFYLTLYDVRFADYVFACIVTLSLGYLAYAASREKVNRAKFTLVIGLLCLISVAFWAFYFQMFLSLTLFISRVVEKKFFGLNFPPPYYVSVQSIGMLVFGYFLARGKVKFNLLQTGISTGNKFTLAMLFMTFAYILITVICHNHNDEELLSPLYFLPVYLLISIAELLLSPVGLAAITVLSSRKRVSTMTGIFFVSLGVGGFLSGKLAHLTSVSGYNFSMAELNSHYTKSFTSLLGILLVTTLVCFLINRIIYNLLKNRNVKRRRAS